MNRVVWFIICSVIGLELLIWGLLVPAHIGAVDAEVLEQIGHRSPSLSAEGLSLVNLEKTGPARILLKAAQATAGPEREKLAAAITTFEDAQPKLKVFGAPALYLERILEKVTVPGASTNQSFVELLVSTEARDRLIESLRFSHRPGVIELLKTRELTNTVIFPPALSPSGQPLDAAIVTTAVLFQQDQFTTALRNSIQELVAEANRGNRVAELESIYLDLLALGKRLNWGQLVALVQRLPDIASLQNVASQIREKEADLPVIYSAVYFADSPAAVSKYLTYFPATGIKDLRFAMHAGSGAVRELLARQDPVYYPTWREKVTGYSFVQAAYQPMARLVGNQPGLGFLTKYGLCFLGALLMARAVTYLSPSLLEEIISHRPILTGPQVAIALCLLFVVLFFTESSVTRATPAVQFPLQIKIPVARAAPRATIPQKSKIMIDRISLVSLLTFFVMQATIYVICRMKLAELRRQSLSSKLKLRLLENEEQLFDAGLYFGFVGTVVSLILVSIGIIKPSLMAAYSSTSFGIVFVSILKIFHVRPYRRRLILDAEIGDREPQPA